MRDKLQTIWIAKHIQHRLLLTLFLHGNLWGPNGMIKRLWCTFRRARHWISRKSSHSSVHETKHDEMYKRPALLLGLDAFGTLFRPRAPIGQLYREAASRHEWPTRSEAQLEQRFRQSELSSCNKVLRSVLYHFSPYGNSQQYLPPQSPWRLRCSVQRAERTIS